MVPPPRGVKKGAQSEGSNNSISLILLLVVMGVAVYSFASVIILAVGLLPSLMVFVIGPSVSRMYVVLCVASTNLCGIAPALAELWEEGGTLNDAMAIMQDPFTWLVMYGASGIGWLLIFALPPILAIILKSTTRGKIRDLEKKQKKLIKEWGENVSNPKIA